MKNQEEIEKAIYSAIVAVQTHAHRAKSISADLRSNGFDGHVMGDLRIEAEKLLKSVHEYQAYTNCLGNSPSVTFVKEITY